MALRYTSAVPMVPFAASPLTEQGIFLALNDGCLANITLRTRLGGLLRQHRVESQLVFQSLSRKIFLRFEHSKYISFATVSVFQS